MAVTTLKRLGAAALSAAILVAPVVAVSSADAAPAPERAGKSWSVIAKWYGAKQQACKVSIRDGKAWKVHTRVVNGRQAEIGVGLMVNKTVKGKTVTKDDWRSPIMGKGKTSKVGSVVLPIGAAWTMDAFQFQGQMGDGGPVSIKKIRKC